MKNQSPSPQSIILERARLGSYIAIKSGDEDADFWIVRRGSIEAVGKPSRDYLANGFGISIKDGAPLDPRFAYYAMEHLWRMGYWKGRATGSTKLVNIRSADILEVPLQEAAAAQTPVTAFLRDFDGMSEPNPLNPRKRVMDGALVELSKGFYDETGTIDIADIQSHRRGAGTQALTAICALADRHGVRLDLYAKGYAHVATDKLMLWYERFGFFADEDVHPDDLGPNDGVDMSRTPKHQGPIKLSGFARPH